MLGLPQHGGQFDGLATGAVEEVVVGSEAVADPAGSPPAGHRPATGSQEEADDDGGQSPCESAMQRRSQHGDPGGPLGGQLDGEHPRPSPV